LRAVFGRELSREERRFYRLLNIVLAEAKFPGSSAPGVDRASWRNLPTFGQPSFFFFIEIILVSKKPVGKVEPAPNECVLRVSAIYGSPPP